MGFSFYFVVVFVVFVSLYCVFVVGWEVEYRIWGIFSVLRVLKYIWKSYVFVGVLKFFVIEILELWSRSCLSFLN